MLRTGNRIDVYDPGQLKQKLRFILIIVFSALAILSLRLWYLQVIKGDEFRQSSENNSLRLRKIKPLRGLIMDRNRRIIADNRPSFDIIFIPDKKRDINQSIEKIKRAYAENSLEFSDDLSIPDRIKPFVPIILERNVSLEKIAVVETHSLELPDVETEIAPVRQYLYGEATAQVIGFTGEASSGEIEKDISKHLSPGDIIGKFGIEKSFDRHLRGENGAEQVEINVSGKIVRFLDRIPSTPGDIVVLNIDLDLQKTAWQALGDRKGTVVVMNPQNGEVLALVSSPSFDPNLFSGKISAEQWKKLSNNPRHPMENRAVSGQYPPGSTYKPIVAAAALETGIISPETIFQCGGDFKFGQRIFHDWKKEGHGAISLHRAIVESCDVYFYNLGKMLDVDKIAEYAKGFGLGAPTGIDIPHEKGGLVPTKSWKRNRLHAPWYAGETIPLAIGQGYNLVTPVQLANAYAALANGGTLYRPRIVKQIESPDGRIIESFPPQKIGFIPVKPQNIDMINKALWGVVNEEGGTGYILRRKNSDVCGKTGTAQVVGLPQDPKERKTKTLTSDTKDHALFVCFAPYAKPEIVVAVVLENAGHGGSVAAPVARKIIEVYFAEKNSAEKI
jgi:penicillin-binding protein 2